MAVGAKLCLVALRAAIGLSSRSTGVGSEKTCGMHRGDLAYTFDAQAHVTGFAAQIDIVGGMRVAGEALTVVGKLRRLLHHTTVTRHALFVRWNHVLRMREAQIRVVYALRLAHPRMTTHAIGFPGFQCRPMREVGPSGCTAEKQKKPRFHGLAATFTSPHISCSYSGVFAEPIEPVKVSAPTRASSEATFTNDNVESSIAWS